ncbi:MAG: DegV family protein [Clostridia bacterium]|nr:DegV family protein [Clostridia bacterium]
MSKVKIITDSNSGILQSEAEQLNLKVVPMPFTIDGEEYLEELTMSQDKFYELLKQDPDINTSQPSVGYLQDLWDETLKDFDEVVFIPMSSGLSGTCSSAIALSQEYNGKVEVVDNKRISVTQKESIFEALSLAEQGKSAKEIKEYLENTSKLSSIYITLSTLKYLKKGGRISPAAAALGSMLKIKPILCTRGGKFEKFAMALTFSQAKRKMLDQIKKEFSTEFKDEYEKGLMMVSVAHTQNEVEALKFKEEILKELPKATLRFVDPLSLSVSCHIGPGALAIAVAVNNTLNK